LAEKIGLVVITLERYIKTVHAIVHRNYYRNWMTRVGVVVPWIAGFCTFAITAIVSSKPVPGRCPVMGYWPSKEFQTVSLNHTQLALVQCFRNTRQQSCVIKQTTV